MPELPTSPIWWSREQLDALQSKTITASVLELQRYLNNTYDSLIPHLESTYPDRFPPGKFGLYELTWSALHIWGRAFDTSANDEEEPTRRSWGMIPFADLVNHQSYVESFYGDSDGEGPFECWATECFAPGEELFQSYGSHKSSTHYFLYYGFVPRGYIRSDFVSFQAADGKNTVKSPIGIAGPNGHVSEEFIVLVRDQLLARGLIDDADYNETQGYRSALQHTLNAIETEMSELPSTHGEDMTALMEPFETYDKWVSLTVRTRFKFVLQKVQENLAYRMENDPTNSSAWKDDYMNWLLVEDDEEVDITEATKSTIHNSLKHVVVKYPDSPVSLK
jgi:hypothetical protein